MQGNERILVVEPEPWVAKTIQSHLSAAGYSVTIAEDGHAALREFFEAERPALVTLELNLVGISGFRLLELFKRHHSQIPILVITSLAFEEAEDAVRAGANGFMSKPIDPHHIVHRVIRQLQSPAAAHRRRPGGLWDREPNQTTNALDKLGPAADSITSEAGRDTRLTTAAGQLVGAE
jgi:DNA-binding response OmpR family regulator